ncbi:Hypothetical predicted protein [Octopus vulgaris]|uniref:Uncharacterized protein n=1 Tax=Octopus vulgaris TaxID=6645 RepID=A0AA36AFC7_OCTVU|nr:Hypothetical predicted protein [Octopus vulgaris]
MGEVQKLKVWHKHFDGIVADKWNMIRKEVKGKYALEIKSFRIVMHDGNTGHQEWTNLFLQIQSGLDEVMTYKKHCGDIDEHYKYCNSRASTLKK